MGNWLVSSLCSKASIVLFDGFPMYKKKDLLLNIVDKEKITLFGVSAKYIDALRKLYITTHRKYKLNFRFEAKYDFANNELIIEKLVNEKENYTEEQIRILNKQVQSYMYKKSLNEIFNILKLRIFINNLI